MTTGANPTPAPTTHDRAREAIADVLGSSFADEIVMVGKGSDPRLYRNEEAILAALEAAGLAVVDLRTEVVVSRERFECLRRVAEAADTTAMAYAEPLNSVIDQCVTESVYAPLPTTADQEER